MCEECACICHALTACGCAWVLQKLRESQHRAGEIEANLGERVGELVTEVEAYRQREEKQFEELATFKEQLERAEHAMQTFKLRVETDYVSREQVR